MTAPNQFQEILNRAFPKNQFVFAPSGTYRERYTGPCRENCEICGGAGWVRADLPRDHPDFGHLLPCPNIPAVNRHKFTGRYGLTIEEQNELSWGSIMPISQAEQITEKFKAILQRGYGLVYLHGLYGLGKTLLLKVAVAETIRAGGVAAYANFPDILDDIRAAYDKNDPRDSALERMQRWQTVPLLAIDEFSRANASGWVQEKTFQLLDRRHVDALRWQTVTLIASNEPPATLPQYLADRLADGRHMILEISGKSVRSEMTTDYKF